MYRSAEWWLFFGWLAMSAKGSGGSDDKIIGGKLASKMVFMASFQHIHEGHRCGSTLLTMTRLVSACHCLGPIVKTADPLVQNIVPMSPSLLKLMAGDVDLQSTSPHVQTRQVKNIYKHPKCRVWNKTIQWDLALIVAATPFYYTEYVRPLELYSTSKSAFEKHITQLTEQNRCWSIGWGRIVDYPAGDVVYRYLKEIRLKVISQQKCRVLMTPKNEHFRHHDYQSKAQMCAVGTAPYESLCQGDSGGPLVCDGYIVGVASFLLIPCNDTYSPTVFAKLSEFVEWYSTIFRGGTLRSSGLMSRVSPAFIKFVIVINVLKP